MSAPVQLDGERLVPHDIELQPGRMYLAVVNANGHLIHAVERSELALEVADKLAVHHGPFAKRRNARLQKAAHEAMMDFFLELMRL